MKKSFKNKCGSALVIAIVTIAVGSMTMGGLLRYTAQNTIYEEKHVARSKTFHAIQLGMKLFNSTLNVNPNITDAQMQDMQRRIGGNANTAQTVFGYTRTDTPSNIPGFSQLNIVWNLPQAIITNNTMQAPADPTDFWFFPGSFQSAIVCTYDDPVNDATPAMRKGMISTLTNQGATQMIPVFNMLSFYDSDWEIAANWESAQLIGRIHTNGSIYLDCRSSGPDRVRFHGLDGAPILTAYGYCYRRGRNGATSFYEFGDTANSGLDFYLYREAQFNNILGSDFRYYNQSNIWWRDLYPGFTNSDNSSTGVNRRFAGNSSDCGYVFVNTYTDYGDGGIGSASKTNFDKTTGADTYTVITAGNDIDPNLDLQPPVTVNPYQYIEDVQFEDTPDTFNSAPPDSSNYSEDRSSNNRIAQVAMNSLAALVIRDGVAYYRETPMGDLIPVISLVNTDDEKLYPSEDHADAAWYGDLRWYGWFGMYDGVSPSPSNPARWHFPIKSVTYNATIDTDNGGDTGTSSDEGTAVPFTFRDATVYTPQLDGYMKKGDGTLAVSQTPWIDRTNDIDDLSDSFYGSYPATNTTGASNADNGAGVGMWNVAYPTIDSGSVERYDPVRVAYNVVKQNIRRVYNADHIYTSKHDGTVMLNRDGTDPGAGVAPDVWGNSITAASFANGKDFNGDGRVNFSTFWNDDATNIDESYRYYRIKVYDNNDAGSKNMRVYEIAFYDENNNQVTMSYIRSQGSNTSNPTYVCDTNPLTFWSADVEDNGVDYAFVEMDAGAGNEFKLRRIAVAARGSTAPKKFIIQASKFPFDDSGTENGNPHALFELSNESGWNSTTGEIRDWFYGPYIYTRSSGNTIARDGRLQPTMAFKDTTSKVELFPIRHSSLADMSTPPSQMDHWFIYKSTLPLVNRTLKMPADRSALTGVAYNTSYGNENESLALPTAGDRRSNFSYPGSSTDPHNWYVLQNNANEMLARQSNSAVTFETPNTGGLYYYAGDAGGYYGNDNLCMIDAQEKKIVAFTEFDMAEFGRECLEFNGLTGSGGVLPANVLNTDATSFNAITASENLQNIIYVVNTTMGDNFYGKRVHCGAVRLKRGRILPFRLSLASPNAVHVWGDFNCPGYRHHGKLNRTNVDYTVPVRKEWESTGIARSSLPAAIYADSVTAYENSWIPFNFTDTAQDDLRDNDYGTLSSWTASKTDDRISYDHKLWWEDDGMRRERDGDAGDPGTQCFLNYHEILFNHNNNNYYAENSAWGNRGSSHQIWKHIPQCINAAFFYGNVPSKVPSVFTNDSVNNANISARPASVTTLDWLMSMVPRAQWIELNTTQLQAVADASGLDISGIANAWTGGGSTLTLGDYYDLSFPQTGTTRFENCKQRFSGGGFLFDIRFTTNHTHDLAEWTSGQQTFGRNITGSFACLFASRQNFHGYNDTLPCGTEAQQIFYNYDLRFNNSNQLPPGTPLANNVPPTQLTIQGTKIAYD